MPKKRNESWNIFFTQWIMMYFAINKYKDIYSKN